MLDQASELRKMMGNRSGTAEQKKGRDGRPAVEADFARVVSITSGKGGVGKSNLAVNLAIQLARENREVVLMDMDIGLANVDILLDINPRYRLSHLVREEVSLEDGLVEAPGGINVLPGVSGVDRLINMDPDDRKQVLKILAEVQRRADVVVVDTGAGVSESVIPFAACADDVLTVITPEPTAKVDACTALDRLAEHPSCGELRVLVNKARDRDEASDAAEDVERVASRFLDVFVSKLGYVLFDDRMAKSVRSRTPVTIKHPDAPSSRCIRTIAGMITGSENDGSESSSHFLRRCIEWLMPI